MFALSPYGKMKREIRTLEEDQIFIRRQLSVMDNSPARDNALSALEVSKTRHEQVERKFKKFRRWFYPVSAIVGVGMLYLADYVYSQ